MTDDPIKLYKYKSIGIKGTPKRKHFEQLIVENSWFFSKPSILNDTFDCMPSVKIQDPTKDAHNTIRKITEQSLVKMGQNKTSEEIDAIVNGCLETYTNTKESTHLLYNTIDEKLGLFCLSKTPTSLQQWAYYANDNSGICLEFSIPETSDWYRQEVIYQEKRPAIDIIEAIVLQKINPNKFSLEINEAIITKHKSWQLEEEVRILAPMSRNYPYPSEYLTKIIFGLKTKPDDIEHVKTLITKSKSNPILSRCVQSTENYEFDIVDLEN